MKSKRWFLMQKIRAGYLEKFSPGHYDLTFVLGQNGLNEDAVFLIDVSFCQTKEGVTIVIHCVIIR